MEMEIHLIVNQVMDSNEHASWFASAKRVTLAHTESKLK